MRDYGPLRLRFPDQKDWTLSAVLGTQAARYEDKIFLVQPGRAAISYRAMDDAATCIAHNLMARGFQVGDRLMVLADNCFEYVQAWFGASRAGRRGSSAPTRVTSVTSCCTPSMSRILKACLSIREYAGGFADIAGKLRNPVPRFFLLGDDVESGRPRACPGRAGIRAV